MIALLRPLIVAGALAWTMVAGASAGAQEGPGPSVRGSVGGDLAEGSRVRFQVAVTHPDGWRALDRVRVALELHGVALDEIGYEVAEGVLTLGGGRAVAGTGNALVGRFLRVDAFGVAVSSGGNRLELSFPALVLRSVPPEAQIRFVGEDHEGGSAENAVRAVVPDEGEGSTLLAVLLTAAAALLAGGYLGARMAGHRRRPSVYEAVARRIVEEREVRARRG